MFYEQKMTSLVAPELWRFWRIQEKAKKMPEEARKRPEEAKKRPGRGQKNARRGQEEARRGPKRPGIQNLAKNCSKRMFYEQINDVSGGA